MSTLVANTLDVQFNAEDGVDLDPVGPSAGHQNVGHLQTLSIGGTAIKPTFKVGNPENLSDPTKTPVVALMHDATIWPGKIKDAFQFCLVVPKKTGDAMAAEITSGSGTEAVLTYMMWSFDTEAKKYELLSSSDGKELKGVIKRFSKTPTTIGGEAAYIVNVEWQAVSDKEQEIVIANGTAKKSKQISQVIGS